MEDSDPRLPSFSVVIPTRNRPERLAQCLKSLCNLDYPADRWEVIVVNDGGQHSFEGLREQDWPFQVMWHTIPHGGPGAARNQGAGLARYDLLAFTDDDCRVDPRWLRAYAAGFAGPEVHALGGRSLSPPSANTASQAWHTLIDFLYQYMRDDRGNVVMVVSNNAAYRRAAFEAVRGYDESFTIASEDREISLRFLAAGYAQGYCPAAQVFHYQEELTAARYVTMQFRYGRGGHYFVRGMGRVRVDLPLGFYQRLKLRYPFALGRYLWKQRAPLRLWFLLGVAQVAHRLGRYYEGLLGRGGAA